MSGSINKGTARPGFLSTTRGKILALLLIIVIVGAAGAASLSFSWETTVTVTTGEETNTTLAEDYYAEETLTFSYGHRRMPVSTQATVTFPVEENASVGSVETDGDTGAIPRYDGGDRKEVDITVNGANGKMVAQGATPQMNEIVDLKRTDFEYGGVGQWEVVVDCYSGTNVQVTVKITVNYAFCNDTNCTDDKNETMRDESGQEPDDGGHQTDEKAFIERETRTSTRDR
jgi:hypothetical protein